ncbi:sensor domain-containing phosphodiesterase [Phytohalomonas tamaricis]|uniref:sensor domain-containing phosphodiesterase n=1 Tax=Phytohalomonas tamaricis TaxID=2081032 RepID=UPI000D0B7254|nr:GGDEF and EAL domain-containing protein [Phytohalomonas tamaricis]
MIGHSDTAIAAAPYPHEHERLKALHCLSLLDTPAEKRFDNITALAARLFNVPIVLITLIDAERQWFKSHHGLSFSETPRDWSFCSHAIHDDGMLVIENTLLDERFATNPLVINSPNIRFYAGAVIRSSSGMPLGTICLLDNKPRRLTLKQCELLKELARFTENEIDQHATLIYERAEADLRADIDPLTHFATLDAFDNTINGLLAACPDDRKLSLIMIEIADMSLLERVHGFTAVKFLLVEVARRLHQAELEGIGLRARIREGTFGLLLLLPHDRSPSELCVKLNETLNAPMKIKGLTSSYAFRIMTVDNCAHFEQARHILMSCDHVSQMNELQETHCLQVDSEHYLARLKRLIGIRQRLPEALANNQLTLHYQPKINALTNTITGVEALLRWHDKELGYVSPLDILDIAEELGICRQIDAWVIQTAIAQLARWMATGVPVVPVAINVAQEKLARSTFPEMVEKLLVTHQVSPKLIEFEIVERSMISNYVGTLRNMALLKAMGISFSIDDFGTGYSSLSYLNRLPVSTIKIDRSFITPIFEDTKAAALVQSIIDMGHSIGLKVVAEGVETIGQHLILRAYRCDEIQGFYFSKPLSPDEISLLLTKQLHHSPPLD